MAAYYKHSGKFKLEGLLFGLLAGAILSIPAAFLYNYGIVSIPEAKLRGICTLAFGALIGTGAGIAMCWGKVRNGLLAGVVGIATSFFGLYLSWIAWILHWLYPSHWLFNLSRPAMHPEGLWRLMLEVNKVGTWGLHRGKAEHGTILWVIWIGEAALVLLASTMSAVYWVRRRPFCEHCEQWCTEPRKLFYAPTMPAAEIKAQLESQDVKILEKLTAGNKKQAHYRIDLETCGICHSLNTLSFVQVFPRDHKTVVNKLMLSQDQAGVIRNLELTQQVTSSVPTAPASAN